MTIEILKAGMLTTVQDLGRVGYQKYGVIKSGAMDFESLQIANGLVGNPKNEAAIEMTLFGASFLFHHDTIIALTGADMSPTINGKPIKTYRSILVTKGSVLKVGQAKKGCRSYLAVAGGIQVPDVMGSHATYLRAEIGGYHGRSLDKEDSVHTNEFTDDNLKLWATLCKKRDTNTIFIESEWTVNVKLKPDFSAGPTLRVFEGREYDWLTAESNQQLFAETFRVSPESDRMGYRLNGPQLELKHTKELLSEPVTFGTIQSPAGGKPILLMADRQTTGGYAKILQIATVDLPVAAQLKPGDTFTFQKIHHSEAEALYLERELELRTFQIGMGLKESLGGNSNES